MNVELQTDFTHITIFLGPALGTKKAAQILGVVYGRADYY